MISDLFLAQQKKLQKYLQPGYGCRIGEASVCSRQVHTIDPYRPEIVSIIKNADAGHVFYGRKQSREIIHIDIFHELKLLSAPVMAVAVKRGLESYAQELGKIYGYEYGNKVFRLIHYFDLQTATGGGRVSGKQNFGQRAGVKKAHLNHVHLTGKVADKNLALVFFVIRAVEKAIMQQGCQLRRVEFLQHEYCELPERGNGLAAYSTFTDTFLRERSRAGAYQAHGYELSMIADIMEHLEDLAELQNVLKSIPLPVARTPVWPDPQRQMRLQDAQEKLLGYGFIEKRGVRQRLTEEGRLLSRFLIANSRELELGLRRESLSAAAGSASASGPADSPGQSRLPRRGMGRRKIVAGGGEFIAPAPTLVNAMTRSLQIEAQAWTIREQDLRFKQRRLPRSIDICLLLDASASMAGRRMKIAKNLAEYLLQKSRDRIAVITFQEQAVDIVSPFTRNRLSLKQNLETIKAGGLTPLAAGLREAAGYLASCQRRGLLLLVTDGIPTLGEHRADPLQDALIAAANFRQATKFNLACIGLHPNKAVLEQIAEAAAGSLHVVEELHTADLVSILDKERSKLL